ncbi:MAG: flavodoxin family protein [Anaerolineae bacterium]|nr:flavodoxin family protein [Anaerolineae bacterium]
MNIGVIVYSLSGHTLSLATSVKEKLSAAGHTVSLEQADVKWFSLNRKRQIEQAVNELRAYRNRSTVTVLHC